MSWFLTASLVLDKIHIWLGYKLTSHQSLCFVLFLIFIKAYVMCVSLQKKTCIWMLTCTHALFMQNENANQDMYVSVVYINYRCMCACVVVNMHTLCDDWMYLSSSTHSCLSGLTVFVVFGQSSPGEALSFPLPRCLNTLTLWKNYHIACHVTPIIWHGKFSWGGGTNIKLLIHLSLRLFIYPTRVKIYRKEVEKVIGVMKNVYFE